MSVKKPKKAKKIIKKLRLDHYVDEAMKLHRLNPSDVKIAAKEYRQFL